jgi:GNAT superfamily N-acetyltransferase
MNITYLADHQEAIPMLAEWFYREWSYLYPNKTVDDVRNAIGERVNRDTIPVALVAFEEKTLVGTVCLKTHDMDTRLELSPWLAGLYVGEPWRGKGLGTALVKAIEEKAEVLGVQKLYLYTPSAESFYLRMAWRIKEGVEYHGARVMIMEKEMTL